MGAMQEPLMVCGFANFVFCKLHRVNEIFIGSKTVACQSIRIMYTSRAYIAFVNIVFVDIYANCSLKTKCFQKLIWVSTQFVEDKIVVTARAGNKF